MFNYKVLVFFFYDLYLICCMIYFCNIYLLDFRYVDNVLLYIVYNSDFCTLCIILCCNIVVESILKFCIDL